MATTTALLMLVFRVNRAPIGAPMDRKRKRSDDDDGDRKRTAELIAEREFREEWVTQPCSHPIIKPKIPLAQTLGRDPPIMLTPNKVDSACLPGQHMRTSSYIFLWLPSEALLLAPGPFAYVSALPNWHCCLPSAGRNVVSGVCG